MCLFRLPDSVQEKAHCSQAKGFSPVWVSLCLFRLLAIVHFALIAAEGLLATMDEHVLPQAASICAGITALVTDEWPLSIVR